MVALSHRLVVEFPAGASNFTGEMAAELLALVDSGTIRVIDILILTRDPPCPFSWLMVWLTG